MGKMKLFSLLLAVFLGASFCAFAAQSSQKREKKNSRQAALAQEADLLDPRTPKGWYSNYERALQKANERKPQRALLLYFTCSEERKWCKKMDQDTFKDSRVKSIIGKRLIPVWLDFPLKRKLPAKLKEQNQALRQRFAPKCLYPTVVIVSADEKPLGNTISGYTEAREFYKLLQETVPSGKGKK